MKYDDFINIFNRRIFDGAIESLISSMAKSPSRFVGIFRSTPPKAKVLQNISQSQEIKFGDALEEIIGIYLEQNGFKLHPKILRTEDGRELHLDQHFQKENKFFFSEQKVRDDHDSTKKSGQFKNFKDKLEFLENKYGPTNITGFFYFIDPEFRKNQNFYKAEIADLQKSKKSKIFLQYGPEFFEYLELDHVWLEICEYLTEWRNTVPDFPTLNLDANPEETLAAMLSCKSKDLTILLENDQLYDTILKELFPTKTSLNLLFDYSEKEKTHDPNFLRINKVLRRRLRK